MEKIQVYSRKEELQALREASARSGRSVTELVRAAIRKVVLKPRNTGSVRFWDGEPRRTAIEHDSVHVHPEKLQRTVLSFNSKRSARQTPLRAHPWH